MARKEERQKSDFFVFRAGDEARQEYVMWVNHNGW